MTNADHLEVRIAVESAAAYHLSTNLTVYVAADARGARVGGRLYGVMIPILEAQGFHAAFAGFRVSEFD